MPSFNDKHANLYGGMYMEVSDICCPLTLILAIFCRMWQLIPETTCSVGMDSVEEGYQSCLSLPISFCSVLFPCTSDFVQRNEGRPCILLPSPTFFLGWPVKSIAKTPVYFLHPRY